MFKIIFFILLMSISTNASPLVSRESRIVGGSETSIEEFPYQVSLRTVSNSHFCGGAIINSRWILTAAHCLNDRVKNSIRVVVGSSFLSSGGIAHTAQDYIIHPDYNPFQYKNDVALLKTSTTISFTQSVKPIILGFDFVGGGVNAILSGWGSNETSGQPSNQIKKLRTTTITNSDCRSRHQAGNDDFIFDHKLCTFLSRNQGACDYDNGSPLVANGIMIGIASWIIPCGVGYPDTFTRVSEFHSWIFTAIEEYNSRF